MANLKLRWCISLPGEIKENLSPAEMESLQNIIDKLIDKGVQLNVIKYTTIFNDEHEKS